MFELVILSFSFSFQQKKDIRAKCYTINQSVRVIGEFGKGGILKLKLLEFKKDDIIM